MIKISISESDNLTVNYNEKNNTYNIEISKDDNDYIKREDIVNLIERYRKGWQKIFSEEDCAVTRDGIEHFLDIFIKKVKTFDSKDVKT